MAKGLENFIDEKLNISTDTFIKKMNSDMCYQAELSSNSMKFDWLEEFELTFPYINNIVSVPKVTLISEEDNVKIEKAKKITVASVKDLTRHTQYIDKVDKKTQDVQPSKILIERREETFNTYENRFLYTLVDNINRFMMRQEDLLNSLETKNNKTLEYSGTTNNGREKLTIELKITSGELPKSSDSDEFGSEIDKVKQRIKKLKDYMTSWNRSEFVKSLKKARVPFVTPPIKKTNLILKNPNFQMATRLWTFLQTYGVKDSDDGKDGLDTSGDNTLRGILDDAFLMDYYVLDSISRTKKEQKEKLAKYALVMINSQIRRSIDLLLNCGVKITDEELLKMISSEIDSEKNKRQVGSEDVKKKFKNAIDEYLERTKDYL